MPPRPTRLALALSALSAVALVAGRMADARAAAERAGRLLDQGHGKAFVDLQLLKADLSLADNSPDDAEAYVATGRAALAGDGADAGELQGRLHLTLGRIDCVGEVGAIVDDGG